MTEYRITVDVDTECLYEHVADLLVDRLIEEYTMEDLRKGLLSRDDRNTLLTFHGDYPKCFGWDKWIRDGYGITDIEELECNLELTCTAWMDVDELFAIEEDCLACFADSLRDSAQRWQDCVLDVAEGRES